MTFPILGGNGAVAGYQIDNSLRFNSGDSAYLSRTPASAGNRKTWTYSFWTKLSGKVNNRGAFLDVFSDANNWFAFFLDTTSGLVAKIRLYQVEAGTDYGYTTDALFRDVSAWYHIVVAVDTTQATASNRVKLYINGNQITFNQVFGDYPQNYDTWVNSTVLHKIGKYTDNGNHFDGYMSEKYLIDGQALSPTDFGEFDEDSGIWKPIEYTGSYGTNGFYLDFENSGSLGADQSGNGNNFTPTNLASTDQVIDTPTNNFCVTNPLLPYDTAQFSQGNLRITQSSNNADGIRGTIGVKTGKWYWEIYNGGGNASPGIATESATTKNYIGSDSYGWSYFRDGTKYTNDSASSYGASFTSGDVIGVALNMDSNQITFYKNNVSQGVAFTGLPDEHMFPGISTSNTLSVTNIANFGQDSSFAGSKTRQNNSDENGYGDFYYAPPSGYLALCTQNLATELSPTIDDGSAYFHTQLYNGDGTSSNPITNDANAGDFQPDFLWIKCRSEARDHQITDSTRGGNIGLRPNSTIAEFSGASTQFDSDGFTLLDSSNTINGLSPRTYVAWQWKANAGSTSSNTDGTKTTTVQASQTSGFSIVTYNGLTDGQTIGHGLGGTVEMIILKRRDGTSNWHTWHQGLGDGNNYIYLNTTGAKQNDSYEYISNIGSSTVQLQGSSIFKNDTVGYFFRGIEGYSKFGSYTGNGSTDGTFVYTGFRPAFVLTKRTDTNGYSWGMADSKRSPYNQANEHLFANAIDAEYTTLDKKDLLSNGFKHRTNLYGNLSGGTYIYMAFAENPFVSSTGIPVTAR